jgi:hypothetical protein
MECVFADVHTSLLREESYGVFLRDAVMDCNWSGSARTYSQYRTAVGWGFVEHQFRFRNSLSVSLKIFAKHFRVLRS